MKKVVAIIQARMSSTRLPGKVLLDLGGRPVLERMIERVKHAKRITEAVVATTTDPSDEPIVELCARLGTPCFRGSLPDVLDRYYQCALVYKADVIVRLTGDCPLIDPELIDEVVYATVLPYLPDRSGC
jgi:spore coat polysaccharide biosynthesis protein SpsF